MRNEWILDVLTDLKTFARTNGMPTLAEQLDDTVIVALAEAATQDETKADMRYGEEPIVGTYLGGTGAR